MTSLDFLVRLLRWRKLILINTLLVAILAVVISLLLPNWYTARVSILPPQEEALSLGGLTPGIGGSLGRMALGQLTSQVSLPIWASPSDYLAGILRSRRLREPVVREHDLMDVYKCDNVDQALRVLGQHLKIRVGSEGIVRVRVEDKDPERAAAMAASCVRLLDEIQGETRRTRAGDVRRFVAERLGATRAELAAAEESLRVFQERHGLLVPEEQAAALVQTVAKVEAERITTQVERDALLVQMGSDHPEVQRLTALLTSLEAAKSGLEGRTPMGEGFTLPSEIEGPTALIDLKRLPALALQYLRLFRNVEIQQVLFELLTQLLEQYRIREVRDVPTIQVLDQPFVPEEKSRPLRGVICAVATGLAFLLSVLVAAGLEKLAVISESTPERHAQLSRLLSGLGLRFLIPRR